MDGVESPEGKDASGGLGGKGGRGGPCALGSLGDLELRGQGETLDTWEARRQGGKANNAGKVGLAGLLVQGAEQAWRQGRWRLGEAGNMKYTEK